MTHDHIDCEQVLQQLFEYLDGELDDRRQALIEHHLESCRGCFSRAEFERRLIQKLAKSGEVKAPDALVRRVRSLIDGF